jgi:hypothetical protein
MGHDVFSDTWAATDALGRSLPGWEECGAPRANRSVGNFYFICHTGEARYRAESNRLMIAVLRADVGLAGPRLAFDFHWCDNLQDPGDVQDFLTNGDSAPNRRFDYRYRA